MNGRLHYIDALRSFAMLFGLLVHAGTLRSEPVSAAVATASDHFRMATFFVVSGFFAGLVASRRGDGAFVRARAQALLIPLAAGLVLLNPLTNWLVYLWHAGPVGFGAYLSGERPWPEAGPQSWHLHLWFLLALFAYVAAVPLVRPLLARPVVQRGLARLAGLGVWCVPALALVAAGGEVGSRVLWRLTFEAPLDGSPFAWLPRATLGYAVYFLIGLAAYLHRPLFEAMHRLSLATFAVGAALYILVALLPQGLPEVAVTVLAIAAEETVTVAAVCTLLVVFRRFLAAERAWVTRLSGAVYTIYLFHFLLIYALALAVGPAIGSFYVLYALVAVAAGMIGYLLHARLISRVSLLSWLFNGKARLAGQPRMAT